MPVDDVGRVRVGVLQPLRVRDDLLVDELRTVARIVALDVGQAGRLGEAGHGASSTVLYPAVRACTAWVTGEYGSVRRSDAMTGRTLCEISPNAGQPVRMGLTGRGSAMTLAAATVRRDAGATRSSRRRTGAAGATADTPPSRRRREPARRHRRPRPPPPPPPASRRRRRRRSARRHARAADDRRRSGRLADRAADHLSAAPAATGLPTAATRRHRRTPAARRTHRRPATPGYRPVPGSGRPGRARPTPWRSSR